MHAQENPTGRPQTSLPTWTPVRRILCPVDFSSCSRAAVLHAVALARPSGAEIIGLFVLPFVFPRGGEGSGFSGLEPVAPKADVTSAATARLAEFLRPTRDAGLTTHGFVKSGDCVEHILEQAHGLQADLIVMGTHGRAAVERAVLGSVTARVLRKSLCPVLTVSKAGARRRLAPAAPLSRIVCAVDVAEGAASTLSYALSLAHSTGATLTVLHVIKGVRVLKARAHRAAELRRELEAAAIAHGEPGTSVKTLVVGGDPYEAIVRVVSTRRAGLIVIGSARGRRSIASRVIRESALPVVTVPSLARVGASGWLPQKSTERGSLARESA